MADEQNSFPSPKPGDSEDVELALETAQRLYRTGDHVEALKWLRRAVNAADEAGDDLRQLELARAAADYTAFAESLSTAPAVAPSVRESHAPAAPTPSRLPQPHKPPPPPSARPSTVPASPAQTASVPQAKPATLGGPPPLKPRPASVSPSAGASVATPKTRTGDSQIPLAPKAVSVASVTPQPNTSSTFSASRAPVPVVETVSRQSGTSASPSVRPRPNVSASVAKVIPGSQSSVLPSGFHDLSTPPAGSMRVAVRVSARDENLYVVRPLSAGQRVPLGAREAWLFFDEAGAEEHDTALTSSG